MVGTPLKAGVVGGVTALYGMKWAWNFGHGTWDGTYPGWMAVRKFGLDQEDDIKFLVEFSMIENEKNPFRTICSLNTYVNEVYHNPKHKLYRKEWIK